MKHIWQLANTEWPVLLYKADDTHFIVAQDGAWSPILSCGLFVVVNQELLDFLLLYLYDVPRSHPVSIYDYELKKYIEGYHRIYILDPIEPDTMHTLDNTGNKAWRHWGTGTIFISPELKKDLDKASIKGLQTYEGFYGFGGNEQHYV